MGGGTSGLTVAKRLAEDPQTTVAVIEAGSFYEISNGNRSQIPAYDVDGSSPLPNTVQSLVDWGLITTPQTVLISQASKPPLAADPLLAAWKSEHPLRSRPMSWWQVVQQLSTSEARLTHLLQLGAELSCIPEVRSHLGQSRKLPINL